MDTNDRRPDAEITNTVYWASILDDDPSKIDPIFRIDPEQLAMLVRWKSEQRKREWRLSRSLVRRFMLVVMPEYGDIKVLSESSGAPFIADQANQPLAGCLSISHKAGIAACAWTIAPGWQIGVDIERIEHRSPWMFAKYFTRSELDFGNEMKRSSRNTWTTLVWSVKESVVKTMRSEDFFDVRRIELTSSNQLLDRLGSDWQTVDLRVDGVSMGWQAWVRKTGNWLTSLVAHNVGGEETTLGPVYVDIQTGEIGREPPALAD